MQTQQIKQIIVRELPTILQEDPEIQDLVLQLSRRHFADKRETESRFDRLLDELRREREEQSRRWEAQEQNWAAQERRWAAQERKWEEQNRRWEENRAELDRKWEEQNRRWEENRAELDRKWEEQNRRWEEHQAELNRKWEAQERKWEEQNRRWEEHQAELNRKWEEQNRRWEENRAELDRKWEEQNQKWEKNHAEIRQMLEAISNLSRKYNGAIGALGARWGLYSEAAFRNGLKGILEESFDVQVLNVVEYDEQGEVFGRPDQIELDIIVKDGQLIICEIKSSMSKSDMYIFERKVRFYEKLHNRAADRMMVISPMVDKRAQVVADDLGIQVYSYADTVDRAIFEPA